MKRTVFFIISLLAAMTARSQTITLEQCQILARDHYPAIAQTELIDRLAEYSISNARRNWLPQISVSGQATYQSEAIDLPESWRKFIDDLPDGVTDMLEKNGLTFEGLPKDQYKAAIQIEQVIWDGGMIKAQTEAAKAEGEASRRSLETELYAIAERVNQLYFGSLLLQENLRTADLLIEDLERNRRMLAATVELGAAGRNDLDLLDVEILGARQKRAEAASAHKAYLKVLGLMTGLQLGEDVVLVKPEPESVPHTDDGRARPEMAALDAQSNLLEAQRRAVRSSVMPQIGAFFQGAYANPGLNFLEDMVHNRWSPYFIAGVKFQWNIGGFYTKKNRLAQIDLNQRRIDSQKETFLYNISLQSAQERAAIEKMEEIMRYDDEIIELRSSIRRRTEASVENGEGNVNDLLRDINAEDRARQNKAAHEIEWLKNIYDLKYTVNHQE